MTRQDLTPAGSRLIAAMRSKAHLSPYRVLEFLYKPNKLPGDDGSCSTYSRAPTELAEARSYLISNCKSRLAGMIGPTTKWKLNEYALGARHPLGGIRATKPWFRPDGPVCCLKS